jgi:putative two-component system response regulator
VLTTSERPAVLPRAAKKRRNYHILIVDDEPQLRRFCRSILQAQGFPCDEAVDGISALEAVRAKPYDLVLLDIDMPRMTGLEVCRHLREMPPCPHLKIIMMSGRATADDLAQMLLDGSDDYLTKPLSIVQLQSKVKAALRLKEAQDHSDLLNRNVLAVNQKLEQTLSDSQSDLNDARNALLRALTKLTAYRDNETGAHLLRVERYSRCLAEEAAKFPAFAGQIDPSFVELVECSAALHDIGKVGLPDHILLKPGKLDADERIIMQAHTTIGAEILKAVMKGHGSALAFMQVAVDIARHHHERYFGDGYPDRLTGSDIPLAARLVCVADVYDALRSRRTYKPALSHGAALQLMTEVSVRQFDPALIEVLHRCAHDFERIFGELTD